MGRLKEFVNSYKKNEDIRCFEALERDVKGLIEYASGLVYNIENAKAEHIPSFVGRVLEKGPVFLDYMILEATTTPKPTTDIEDYVSAKSLNVLLYAIKVGRFLNYNEDSLKELGIAAFLHDTGLLKLEGDVRNRLYKKGEIPDNERGEINRHTEYGKNIAKKIGFDDSIANIICQTHSKLNKQIAEAALIIGACDRFDASVSPRDDRKKPSFKEKMEYIEKGYSESGRRITNAVMGALGFYSIGEVIRIGSFGDGIVIGVSGKEMNGGIMSPFVFMPIKRYNSGQRVSAYELDFSKDGLSYQISGSIDDVTKKKGLIIFLKEYSSSSGVNNIGYR